VTEEPTVALLALRDFTVISTEELEGELVSVIETTATSASCSRCGERARPKDRRTVTLRDLPAGTTPVTLRWRKRIWACRHDQCPVKTWTERSWLVDPRRVLTNRARREICRRVGEEYSSVAGEARHFGIGWHGAWSCVLDLGRPLLEDPARTEGVTMVGLDETVFLHARRKRRRVFVTGVVDVATGRLLDVFEGRDAKDLRRWMASMPRSWLAGIEVVSVDPHEGYRSAVLGNDPVTFRPSPWRDVTVVVDPFHVVRLANQAVTRCRQRVQQATFEHRGWQGDPLYDVRKLLLLGAERVDERGWARLREALCLGDPFDEVTDTWSAKEKVRDVYLTDDQDEARARLDDALDWCKGSSVPEVQRLGRTLGRWKNEILAHHATGASNGPTEAVNLTIKAVKRRGRGFRNFDNYRFRLLLAAGVSWQTQPVARLRGRPRLVA
jgi:transposase